LNWWELKHGLCIGESKRDQEFEAVIRKEFQEYRRNRFIIYTMGHVAPVFHRVAGHHTLSISNTEAPQCEYPVAITLCSCS